MILLEADFRVVGISREKPLLTLIDWKNAESLTLFNFSDFRQQLRDCRVIDWFHQVRVAADFPGFATIFFLSPSCQSHDEDLLSPRSLSNRLTDFVPISFGKTDI